MVSESAQNYLSQHVNKDQEASVREFLDGLSEPEGDVFEVFEEAEYAAARKMNPELPPFSYLVIRLTGEAVENGGVNHDVAKEILGPISAEIQAAADQMSSEAEMTLVRISKGSLVLHYQPKVPLAPRTVGQADIDLSPVDQAIRDTFTLHTLLEKREKPAVIANRFGANKKFMRSARNLTEALDKLDLNLRGKWRAPTGGHAETKLTEVGRTNARRVFKRIETPDTIVVSGKITGLDLDGIVTVQQTAKRKRKVHFEEPGLLTGGEFLLGADVAFVVEKTESRDQVGLSSKEYLLFKGHHEQETLDIPTV